MRNISHLLPLVLVAGCSTTNAGLAERDVVASYQSTKAPRDLADCLSRNVTWTKIDPTPEGFVTFRRNPYGVPMSRYDVTPADGGSAVVIRSNASFAAGLDKVSACL